MQAATHEITFGPLWSPTPQVWCLGWLQLEVEQPARLELATASLENWNSTIELWLHWNVLHLESNLFCQPVKIGF